MNIDYKVYGFGMAGVDNRVHYGYNDLKWLRFVGAHICTQIHPSETRGVLIRKGKTCYGAFGKTSYPPAVPWPIVQKKEWVQNFVASI